MTRLVCPWCDNDDKSLMEEVSVRLPFDSNGKRKHSVPAILCVVCGKIWTRPEKIEHGK